MAIAGFLGVGKGQISAAPAAFPNGKTAILLHSPFGMAVVLGGVKDEAVVAADPNPRLMAAVYHPFDQVGLVFQPLVDHTRFGGIIAKPCMGLQIDHGIIDLGGLEIFYIGLWRECA